MLRIVLPPPLLSPPSSKSMAPFAVRNVAAVPSTDDDELML
jgi:hypothetical protein